MSDELPPTECPFCETPNRLVAEDLDGCRWYRTFYVYAVDEGNRGSIVCATCGGTLLAAE